MSFFVMILELTKYPPTCTPHTSKPVVLGRRKCYKVKQQKMSLQSLCRTVNICADALIQGKMFNTWLLVMSFCVNVCVLSVTEARNGCCLGGFPCLSCPSGISAVCLQLCAVLRLQMRPELADLIPVPAHCYVCSLQASLLCPSLWHCCCPTSPLSPWTTYGWEPSHLSSHPCSPITGTAGVSSTALSFSKRLFQSLASYNGQHLQHRLMPDPSWSLAVLLPCVPGCLKPPGDAVAPRRDRAVLFNRRRTAGCLRGLSWQRQSWGIASCGTGSIPPGCGSPYCQWPLAVRPAPCPASRTAGPAAPRVPVCLRGSRADPALSILSQL